MKLTNRAGRVLRAMSNKLLCKTPVVSLSGWVGRACMLILAVMFATLWLCPRADCGVIEVKVDRLPRFLDQDPRNKAEAAVLQRFLELHPDIRLKSSTGLRIEGGRSEGGNQDMVPLMQIAGDIAPDVFTFEYLRSSGAYVRSGYLMPLDKFIVKMDKNELARRVPPALRDACYRVGPDGKKHWYMLPTKIVVRMLAFRLDQFARAGLDPAKPPRTWAELEQYSRKLSRPDEGKFGIALSKGATAGYDFASLVWSRGGDIAKRKPNGAWEPSFDTKEVTDALYFYLKLNCKQWRAPNGRSYRGVAARETMPNLYALGYPYGMAFLYVGDRLNDIGWDGILGFGAVPYPDGRGVSEINCRLMGVFSGAKDPAVARAAFDYIAFQDNDEANRVRTKVYVQSGYGEYVNPELLARYGYKSYLKGLDDNWVKVYKRAIANATTEPYCNNSQVLYRELSMVIEQALNDRTATAALDKGNENAAKRRLGTILHQAQINATKRMFGIASPEVRKLRRMLTLVFLGLTAVGFVVAGLYLVAKFRENAPSQTPGYKRSLIPYVLLIPAVGSVILWQYLPLIRGTIMAFQDYNVIGVSPFVGVRNFSEILFDVSFWHSVYVTVLYTALYMSFGFLSPIFLALLLSEVPRGKMAYRTIFYVPAVLSGLVVTFLWKSFYGSSGVLNTLLGYVGIHMTRGWLDVPSLAMVGVLLPVVWAGMGPGSLIYLAAFKTIPGELYEAAEVDGAGMRRKVWNITLPSIKMLISINAIGAFIGAFMTSETIFAMTAGGPYTPYGTTEVVGIQLFYTAFLYLKFGVANAMAWVLGFMLIGFTMLQLKNLSKVEFKGGR